VLIVVAESRQLVSKDASSIAHGLKRAIYLLLLALVVAGEEILD
jgi:hypothetical protein